MSLEPAADASRLYLAVGADVNKHRPLFTGDVFRDIKIPGVGRSPAILIGHPCSIRGRKGRLTDRMPVASVQPHELIPAERWSSGYFNRMPLAGLPLREQFHAARLDLFGLACTDALFATERIACLSHPGINQLQQRLVYHQTRLALPTGQFHHAFEHTYEEADLLEEWNTELSDIEDEPVASFEGWIREGSPTRQHRLEDSQERAPIRREMRERIRKRQNERQHLGR